jgi:hypothetical protein
MTALPLHVIKPLHCLQLAFFPFLGAACEFTQFVVIDSSWLISGSFNWTRAASETNQENVICTNEQGLVSAFAGQFDKLWKDKSIVDDVAKVPLGDATKGAGGGGGGKFPRMGTL